MVLLSQADPVSKAVDRYRYGFDNQFEFRAPLLACPAVAALRKVKRHESATARPKEHNAPQFEKRFVRLIGYVNRSTSFSDRIATRRRNRSVLGVRFAVGVSSEPMLSLLR
jgi:hypothetical protein